MNNYFYIMVNMLELICFNFMQFSICKDLMKVLVKFCKNLDVCIERYICCLKLFLRDEYKVYI